MSARVSELGACLLGQGGEDMSLCNAAMPLLNRQHLCGINPILSCLEVYLADADLFALASVERREYYAMPAAKRLQIGQTLFN
jgi:hypothetical protein